MGQHLLSFDIAKVQDYTITMAFRLGAYKQEELFPIICPYDDLNSPTHKIIRNGHDTKIKGHPQQYYCKYCEKTFFAHTSKIFIDIEDEFKKILATMLKGGRINIKPIAARLNLKDTVVSRMLSRLLGEILKTTKNVRSFMKKRRNSNCLIIDETFITIHKKMWYLILIVSGNDKIMELRLVERRDLEVILEMVKNCVSRLTFGLQMIVSDGFLSYIGVATEIVRLFRKPLIHVRHIHKPPYGRVEIDFYYPTSADIYVIRCKTTNEITAVNGYFLARISEKSIKYSEKQKRGRKTGGTNRSKEVIEAEKREKAKTKGKKGRPKGSKTTPKSEEIHIFFHNREDCRISAVGGSSELVATGLNSVLQQFKGQHITSNLIEKEFSVLKKLLCFRGRRDAEHWLELLIAYYAIRDDPKILEDALKTLTISSQLRVKALSALVTCEILTK